MTRLNDDNDDPRDAHLLAALRHAPDRDALPPRQVSERILAAARAAVRPPRQTHAPWWQRLGAWLVQPRVAAAFGTLAVASLVGVMWSTREPPVAEFVPNAPLADGASRADQRSMAPAPALSTPAEAAEAPEAPKADAGGVAAASAGSSEVRDKAAVAPPPKTTGKDAAVRAESRVRSKAETPAAPAAATTTAAPSTEPPPPPAAAPARQAADAAAPAAAAERRSANESDLQVLARQQGAAASRSASAATLGLSLAAKARAAEPLAAIDAALAAGARWQVAGLAGDRQHGAAQRQWWLEVRGATQGRWQRDLTLREAALPTWLSLLGERVVAVLSVEADALVLVEDGTAWKVQVDAAQVRQWKEQVLRW